VRADRIEFRRLNANRYDGGVGEGRAAGTIRLSCWSRWR